MVYTALSHDDTSGIEITPCNIINKPLVVYRLVRNMMSIITLLKSKILYFQSLPEAPKKEESPEPDWKTNIHLRKVRHTPGPVKGIVIINPLRIETNIRSSMYSKTCVKRPLKNRQNKDFNDK